MAEVIDPKQMKIREEFAEQLNQIRRNFSSVGTLLARLKADTGVGVSEQTYSKVVNLKADPPKKMQKWVLIEVCGGSITIEPIGVDCFDMLVSALARGGESRAVISVATDLIEACKKGAMTRHPRSLLARLYALRAAAYRSLKDRAATVDDYHRAVYYARELAPELVDRYVVGEWAWRSDELHFRHMQVPRGSHGWLDSLRKWEKGQRDAINSLNSMQVLKDPDAMQMRLEGVRLQTVLRCACRLGDKKLFDQVLETARRHKEFGSTPEERDKFLLSWLGNKDDDDFANARAGEWVKKI